MAEHDEHDEHGEHGGDPAAGGDPAGGRHGGKDGGKGGKPAKGAGKLLAGPHGTEIMVICSVVLVGFGYLSIRRSKTAGASPAAGNSLTAAAAGLAGAGSVAGFDQNAYLGLQTALANQSDQLASLLSSVQQGAGGLPAGLPGGTTPQTSPSLPSPLPNTPAGSSGYSWGSTSGASSSLTRITDGLAATGTPGSYTPAAAGSTLAGNGYVGRIDGATASDYYTPVATGVGSQALLGNKALPQSGSLGPVGTVYTDTDGIKKKVTGYTFTGTPNVSWLY